MTNNSKTFGCKKCGRGYDVYPPDSGFQDAYLSPCKETKDLEPNHNHPTSSKCGICGEMNTLYWCQGHSIIEGIE